MLAAMIEGWSVWLLLVGLAIGVATTWVLTVRLPRDEDDVSPEERHAEAAWIATTIDRYGGMAPPSFVEEVLDLHQAYLRTPRAAALPARTTPSAIPPGPPPGPPPPRPGYPGPGAPPAPTYPPPSR